MTAAIRVAKASNMVGEAKGNSVGVTRDGAAQIGGLFQDLLDADLGRRAEDVKLHLFIAIGKGHGRSAGSRFFGWRVNRSGTRCLSGEATDNGGVVGSVVFVARTLKRLRRCLNWSLDVFVRKRALPLVAAHDLAGQKHEVGSVEMFQAVELEAKPNTELFVDPVHQEGREKLGHGVLTLFLLQEQHRSVHPIYEEFEFCRQGMARAQEDSQHHPGVFECLDGMKGGGRKRDLALGYEMDCLGLGQIGAIGHA